VGTIRLIVAGYIDRHGAPNSPGCTAWRARQAGDVSAPTFHQLAQAVLPRLNMYPKERGLDDLSASLQPITRDEAASAKLPTGAAVPPSIRRKVERCLCDTTAALVERGVITSSEVLAIVLPQITSGLRAAAIASPTLRQLYAAIYRAFRRRRSLLLLDLQSQVRIEELPWVAAIERFRNETPSTRELAYQTLEEAAILSLRSFPHAIVPNKLVKEMRALAKGAALDLPLVDELAADIFMGRFTAPFVRAAKQAAELLQGTLYESYYGIDYRRVRQIPEPVEGKRSWFGRQESVEPDAFAELCAGMVGVSLGGWDVVRNGMVIEQQQIVTTQNLAVLYSGLNLHRALENSLVELAQRCFTWICHRQQVKTVKWHAALIMLKQTAYGWRQMIFHLALLGRPKLNEFLAWATDHLDEQPGDFRSRFRPALRGLTLAASGQWHSGLFKEDSAARRFLGWSQRRHWLLGAEPE
jgi:hypothetical protein